MKKEIKPGDVVVVISPDTIRGQCMTVRQNIRVKHHTVSRKNCKGKKQYSRSIEKVCPLKLD